MLDFLDRLALPEKLQVPVVGSLGVLVWGALFYFFPSDMWIKKLFISLWGWTVETVKADWLWIVGVLIVMIIVAFFGSRPEETSKTETSKTSNDPDDLSENSGYYDLDYWPGSEPRDD